MTRSRIAALGVLLAIAAAVCACGGDEATPTPTATAVATVAPNPFAGDESWIAYQTDRTGGEGVWLIHPDGSGDHRVAADVEQGQLLPDWSPDGTKLVFATRGGTTERLYEYDLATETARQLFACEAPCLGDDEPAYSPDGTRIAFVRATGPIGEGGVPADCGLWVGTLSDLSVRQLTSNAACDREYFPRWSPDGTSLIYTRARIDRSEKKQTAVFTIAVDGGEQRQVTPFTLIASSPDWTPDGAWIVFGTYPLNEFACCQASNLFRMRPDGNGVEQLTGYGEGQPRATQPRVRPDGEWIILTRVTEGSRTLAAIPIDGGDEVAITRGGIATHPAWQPATAATP